MTPEELKQKMVARRELAQMVREYWGEMLPDLGDIPEPQLLGWISRFDLDTMVEGINAAMIIRSKQDAAGKETSVQAAVNYASGAMNKLKPADPEKAARISEARSKAGKVGRAKQLAEDAKFSQEFAQVCSDLPEVAQPLPTDNDFGFGSGFDSVSVSVSASASATDSANEVAFAVADERVPRSTETSKAAATQLEENKKKEQNQKTKTNLAGASGISANQDKAKATPKPNTVLGWEIPANTCAFHRERMHEVEGQENCAVALRDVVRATRDCAKCNPPKPKTLKTAMGDRPRPEGFDELPGGQRVEWLNCTCGANPRKDSEGWYLAHNGNCVVGNDGVIKTQAKAAAAAPEYHPLGNVDEL